MATKRWLANEGLTENFDVVLSKWQLTYEIRKHEILDPNNPYLSDFFETWPVLQGPTGYKLVCFFISFNNKFYKKKDMFISKQISQCI